MGISIWQLLILLVIIVLLFGTKRLRSLGGDLGSAIKGFKNQSVMMKPQAMMNIKKSTPSLSMTRTLKRYV